MSDYPDLVNIQFNNTFIRDQFVPGVPHYSPDLREPGYWVIVQDNNVIVRRQNRTIGPWMGQNMLRV